MDHFIVVKLIYLNKLMLPDEVSRQSKLLYLLGQNYDSWQCHTDNYWSYITPDIIIQKIIEQAKEHFNGLSDKVIWDMFAGIGCDGLRLAHSAGKVICTEIDKKTHYDLVTNTKTFGVNAQPLLADCCIYKNTMQCNIVFFDPPWGDTFRSGETFDFKDVILNDGSSILDLLSTVSKNYDMIIKSPISSNSFESVLSDQNHRENIHTFTFTQQKLKFLFVKKVLT